MVQGRSDGGKFAAKSDDGRLVRSLRATDSVWMGFGDLAEEQGITRADLLERWVANPPAGDSGDSLKEVIAILTQALELKANAGGKIKDAIREALAILSSSD